MGDLFLSNEAIYNICIIPTLYYVYFLLQNGKEPAFWPSLSKDTIDSVLSVVVLYLQVALSTLNIDVIPRFSLSHLSKRVTPQLLPPTLGYNIARGCAFVKQGLNKQN